MLFVMFSFYGTLSSALLVPRRLFFPPPLLFFPRRCSSSPKMNAFIRPKRLGRVCSA